MSGLLDFVNGLNNAAASTVSAPVDGISWLMRKAGLGDVIGQNPVGGSDWMQQQGLTRPTNGLLGNVGEFAGNVLPIAAAAKAPQIAKGLLTMGENALAPSDMAMQAQRGAVNVGHEQVLNRLARGVPDAAVDAAFGADGYVYHTPLRPFENAQATAIGTPSKPIAERVFSTEKPLPANVLASIEAVPVSESAGGAFAHELADEGVMGFLHRDGQRFSVVTPSAKEPGRFQATDYDLRGAVGDSQHDTPGDAIHRLIGSGYSKVLPESRLSALLQRVMSK